MNPTPIMSDDEVNADGAVDTDALAAEATGAPPTDDGGRRFGVRWTMGHPDGVVTGLSAELAERLAIDPLWIRLAFVGSALFGGLGVFVYLGLWLALIVARSAALRLIGAGVVIVSFLALADSNIGFSTGPVAVIGLLAGLALALWKPVPVWSNGAAVEERTSNSWAMPRGAATIDAPEGSAEAVTTTADQVAVAQRPRTRLRPTVVTRVKRPTRPPSLLGRSTLGVALIVAAAGALFDELNGGRLHPEQWLGAAAMVCGIGLLVGTVRGHARWLIVPAVALAGAGYAGGTLARIGVQPSDMFTSSYSWTGEGSSGPYRAYTGFGSVQVDAMQVRSSPATVDVRTAAGLDLIWRPEVAVEIRSRLGDVTMRVDGNATTGSTLRLGPDGAPDVVIDLRMVRGDIQVVRVIDAEEVPPLDNELLPADPTNPAGRVRPDGSPIGEIVEVEPGIAVTNDGWIILNGDIIIDQFNNVTFGDWYSPDEQSILINSEIGEYRIVGPVLFTPDGGYFDLDALRQQALDQQSAVQTDGLAPLDEPVDAPNSTVTIPTETLIGANE